MLQKFAMNEDVFGNPLISRQLLLFRIIGYVYSVKDRFQILHFVRGLLSSAVLGILVASQICGIWLNIGNLEMMIVTFGSCIVFTNIVTRIITFYTYNKEYKSLITCVDIGLKKVLVTSLPAEIKNFNKYQKYITTFSYSLFVPAIFGIVYVLIDGFYFFNFRYNDWVLSQESNGTATVRVPVIYVLYPLGNLWENFYFTFILPYVAALFGVLSLVAWHTLNASLMRYISFRLDVIKYKVSNMQIDFFPGADVHDRESNLCFSEAFIPGLVFSASYLYYDEYVNFELGTPHQSDSNHSLIGRSATVLRNVFISCVEDYQEIKSFSKVFEQVTGLSVFIESTTISILLCFILYVMSQDFSAGYGLYQVWCILTIQILFVYYWHGNEILYKSNEMTIAIYSLNWYDFPVPFQKDTLILMTATMKPIMLKAGLFYMNAESLVMILKTSYSYFMLLRKLAE